MRRRSFLSAGAALLLAPPSLPANGDSRIFSAATDRRGRHFLCGWNDGTLLFRAPTEQRAHDVCFHAGRDELLFFARRPGTVLHVVDTRRGRPRYRIASPDNRHFYGHGCLSADGRFLYASENAINDGGRGVIGVYDCDDSYRRTGEFPSGGTGPHQLALMPDGKTLAVANGGILTLPAEGRRKLNLDSMQPALTYIDLASRQVQASVAPPDHRLSLRHLAVYPDGTVLIGAQFQGETHPGQPLVFTHRGEASLRALRADLPLWAQYEGYVASAVADPGGRWGLTTTPRGGLASLWRLDSGEHLRSYRIPDVAGGGYDRRRRCFVVSNGRGQLFALQPQREQPQLLGYSGELQWDNHLAIIG